MIAGTLAILDEPADDRLEDHVTNKAVNLKARSGEVA